MGEWNPFAEEGTRDWKPLNPMCIRAWLLSWTWCFKVYAQRGPTRHIRTHSLTYCKKNNRKKSNPSHKCTGTVTVSWAVLYICVRRSHFGPKPILMLMSQWLGWPSMVTPKELLRHNRWMSSLNNSSWELLKSPRPWLRDIFEFVLRLDGDSFWNSHVLTGWCSWRTKNP